MWTFDPLPPPVTRTLTVYAGGEPHEVTITLAEWDARKRLTYADRANVEAYTPSGELKPETMRLIATSITVTGAAGFPPVGADEFDPTRTDHLLALPVHVLREVQRHAFEVQPLPGSRADVAALAAAAQPPEEEEAVEDPTRTPSTPPGKAARTRGSGRSATSTPTS